MLLLAVNKEFNLRGLFEQGFRALAKAENWYEKRRPMQFVVAVALPSVLALIGAIFLATKGRAFFRAQKVALVGWLLLFVYFALRQCQEWKPMLRVLDAIHYHDWRLALEVAGILLVGLSAVAACMPGGTKKTQSDGPREAATTQSRR